MIKILYFSVVREKLKKSEEEIEFKGSIEELRNLLKEKYPELSEILDKVKFAVNEEYVSDDHIVKDGDTVAVIPPVSGG